MKSWKEMLKEYKERAKQPIDLEKVFKINSGDWSLNVTKISSMDDYKKVQEELSEIYRHTIDELNAAVDKRCTEILRKWGEKFDIEELKTFSYSMPDEQINRLIDKYKFKITVDYEFWEDTEALMCSEILPCQPEIIYVIKKGDMIVIDEEKK
jgi:vacuolar-type H+-ATPase subunit C/Vma6